MSDETCFECPRVARWRVLLWQLEGTPTAWDCGTVCGVHGRKYPALGFSLCGLRPIEIELSLTMEYAK